MNRQTIESGHGLAASFEFFPPKTDAQAEALCAAVERLRRFSPRFVSVTCGARS